MIREGDIVEWVTTKAPRRQTRGRVKFLLADGKARVSVTDLQLVNVPVDRLTAVAR